MDTLRDRLWLWGQTPGSHHAGPYELPGVNRMTPVEGCAFFDIPNCCRVAMGTGPFPPFDEESRQLAHLDRVIWSVIGAGGVRRNEEGTGDLEEVIRQARKFPNIRGAVMDDFLSERRRALFPPERVAEIRRRLNEGAGRPLDLWVVWYDRELEAPVKEYLDLCDVITFWTWYGENLDRLEENLDFVISSAPGKRILAGCYMWDYGNARPLSLERMERQLETYLKYIHSGKIEGMILCSNCIADIGLDTVEPVRQWIKAHGAEPVKTS